MSAHRDRRARLLSETGSGVVLVRGVAPDGASRNYRYLTGLAEPRGVLLMSSDGIRIGYGRTVPGPDYQRGTMVKQVLFLPAGDPLLARWGEDGDETTGTVAASDVGVDAIMPLGQLHPILSETLLRATTLHVVRAADAVVGGGDDPDAAFVDDIRRRFFGLEIKDATAAVHRMRQAKDDAELDAMRHSIAVTDTAMRKVWAAAKPGVHEYELEALLIETYRAAGGGHSFDPIVGSGQNSCLMHYVRNDRRLEAGDILLLDTGACVGGYCADITRTIPVDGTFSPRQREIYDVVLQALEESTAICKPGVTPGEIHARAYEVIAAAGYAEAFVHGTSHHLGLDTHDVGDRFAPLREGAIVTVEPGIYLVDEALGVRIEDDVRITADGFEVLTAAVPKTAEAIESALRELR